jgi:hypothetical protein
MASEQFPAVIFFVLLISLASGVLPLSGFQTVHGLIRPWLAMAACGLPGRRALPRPFPTARSTHADGRLSTRMVDNGCLSNDSRNFAPNPAVLVDETSTAYLP